uniref:Biotin synthase n=1 Tax=Lygus hesperus TaxID=30085 RepID=A0A0A9X421_LYGHE
MAFVGKIDVVQNCATWNLEGMGRLKRHIDLRSEIFSIPALGRTSKFHIKVTKYSTYSTSCCIQLLGRGEQRDQIVSYEITGSHCEQDPLQAQGSFKMYKMEPIPESEDILDYDDYDWEVLGGIKRLPSEDFIRDDKARVHVKLWRGGYPEPKCYCTQLLPMPEGGLKAICN